MPLNLTIPSLNFHTRQSPTSQYSCLKKAINERDNKLISRTSFSASQPLCGFVLHLLQSSCRLMLKEAALLPPPFSRVFFHGFPFTGPHLVWLEHVSMQHIDLIENNQRKNPHAYPLYLLMLVFCEPRLSWLDSLCSKVVCFCISSQSHLRHVNPQHFLRAKCICKIAPNLIFQGIFLYTMQKYHSVHSHGKRRLEQT